jgi:hypothetical protein
VKTQPKRPPAKLNWYSTNLDGRKWESLRELFLEYEHSFPTDSLAHVNHDPYTIGIFQDGKWVGWMAPCYHRGVWVSSLIVLSEGNVKGAFNRKNLMGAAPVERSVQLSLL